MLPGYNQIHSLNLRPSLISPKCFPFDHASVCLPWWAKNASVRWKKEDSPGCAPGWIPRPVCEQLAQHLREYCIRGAITRKLPEGSITKDTVPRRFQLLMWLWLKNRGPLGSAGPLETKAIKWHLGQQDDRIEHSSSHVHRSMVLANMFGQSIYRRFRIQVRL